MRQLVAPAGASTLVLGTQDQPQWHRPSCVNWGAIICFIFKCFTSGPGDHWQWLPSPTTCQRRVPSSESCYMQAANAISAVREIRRVGPFGNMDSARPGAVLGRFWRYCGGIVSSCMTPAADCGLGTRCGSRRIKLVHFAAAVTVISRVTRMGQGISIVYY
jgi:hypothetical protein